MSAQTYVADVTTKRSGVRFQTTDRRVAPLNELLDTWLPGYITGAESNGARIVRVQLRPAGPEDQQ